MVSFAFSSPMFGASKRVSELEEDLSKVKRRLNDLEFAWEDTQARLKRYLQSIAKKSAMIDQANEPEAPAADLPPSPGDNGTRGFLSDRQRQIQQQILKRRAGLA